jgi:hypothetical protein
MRQAMLRELMPRLRSLVSTRGCSELRACRSRRACGARGARVDSLRRVASLTCRAAHRVRFRLDRCMPGAYFRSVAALRRGGVRFFGGGEWETVLFAAANAVSGSPDAVCASSRELERLPLQLYSEVALKGRKADSRVLALAESNGGSEDLTADALIFGTNQRRGRAQPMRPYDSPWSSRPRRTT